MDKLFTAMILVFMIPIVVMVEVSMTKYHIDGRAGCKYEVKCCHNVSEATITWYNIGGGLPLKNSSNILITEDETGCKTIKFQPACEGTREFTCTGILEKSHKFSSRNLRVKIPFGSKPQTIKVLGGTQKNTTNRTSINVTCEVESCLSSTEYSVRFRDHNGKIKNSTELMNGTSFNASITIDVNEIDTYPHVYMCELFNSRNELLDSATFILNGTVNPLVRLSGSGHIDGRIGCTYERKCCMESKLDVHLEWYPIGGGNPISNSRRIGIKKSVEIKADSEPKKCITIIVPSKHKGLEGFTCFGQVKENGLLSTVNLQINTTSDLIKLDQTEIVGNLGENITVTGRVESCLSSIYKVQLFCPNGTKNYSTNFIDCPTYNFSFPIKLNSSDNQCRLTIVNEHGKVQDSKSFNITVLDVWPVKAQKYNRGENHDCVPPNGTCEPPEVACSSICVKGCGCPKGQVIDRIQNECVTPSRCSCTESLCKGNPNAICLHSNVTTIICEAYNHANSTVEVPSRCGSICRDNPSKIHNCLSKWARCLHGKNDSGQSTGAFRCSTPT